MSKDTKPVRASENLDWENLQKYVRGKLKEILGDDFDETAKFEVEQFPGGHSNLTYLLRFGTQEFVLRRPPFGDIPAKAHDMAREFRILETVHPVYNLAPRPFVLCEDAEIIGSTFYVMERRKGIVIRNSEPAEIENNPAKRRKVSEAMIDALVALHKIDIEKQNLTTLGKPEGFVTRQVNGWTKRWHNSKTVEISEMNFLSKWLSSNLPPETTKPTLVHGDFKLDNAMFDAETCEKIVGVFDWEMSAIGDPLIDLGILICYWIHWAKIVEMSKIKSLEIVTIKDGWFSREEIIENYRAKSGRDLTNFTFYEVFAVFKLAVVLQQIFYRYHKGQTDDPRFAKLGETVKFLAETAVNLLKRS
ncbi:MAG TPA: phosphotransferase family protein [Pyrinomonadaceae bacterium]|nr:phosphotransferase family protein [Pyrinomonadaceae bacterium]